MALMFTGQVLDYILIGILVLSLMIGYKKGLISSVVSFGLSIVALLIAYSIKDVVAAIVPHGFLQTLPPEVNALFGKMLLSLCGFGFAFIALSIVQLLIMLLLNTLLNAIKGMFSIVEGIDGFLGAGFTVLKNYLLVYIVLTVMMTPFFSNGQQVINDSKLASKVLEIAPSAFKQVSSAIQTSNGWMNDNDVSVQEAMDAIAGLSTMGVLDHLEPDSVKQFLEKVPTPNYDEKQIQEINDMIDGFECSEEVKAILKEKIAK